MALTHPPDRDTALDRILRRLAPAALDRTLRRVASADEPPASGDCLDAETVAAMADGGLPPHERSAAVEHASTCARCQALIAALIRMTPEPAPRRAWWQVPAVRWLTPVAATGLAVAVWVAVDSRRPNVIPVPVSEVAPEKKELSIIETPQERDARAAVDAVRPAAPPAPEERQATAAVDARRDAAPDVPAPSAPPKKERSETSSAIDQLASAKRKDDVTLDKAVAAEAPVPARAQAPALPLVQMAPPITSNVPGPAAPNTGRGGAAAGNAVQTGAFADRASLSALNEAVRVTTDITSSDPRSRWRIIGPSVERSIDEGATWTVQATGTAAQLTAGSAPQPDICWIVGDDGTVLLTVDGLAWQRIKPPVQAPLVSVTATSADAATVTTRDGHIFVTTDRGRTWAQR